MVSKTAAERKAAERARREKMGMQRLELWLHPEDIPPVKSYAARLMARRAVQGDEAMQERLNKRVEDLERTGRPKKR